MDLVMLPLLGYDQPREGLFLHEDCQEKRLPSRERRTATINKKRLCEESAVAAPDAGPFVSLWDIWRPQSPDV